jgi:hypothetical protein
VGSAPVWFPGGGTPVARIRIGRRRGFFLECVEPLTPYGLEVIKDHARDAGPDSWVEVAAPPDTSAQTLRHLRELFAPERARGCDVRVVIRMREPAATPPPERPVAHPAPVREREVAETIAGEEGVMLGLMRHVGRVLHEMQRERDYGTVHAASRGRLFDAEARHQHDTTDDVARSLQAFVETHADALPRTVALCAEVALEALQHLPVIRECAALADATSTTVLEAYARPIASLLAVAHVVAASENDAELARMALAHAAFLNAKEQAGRERAEIASAWAVEGYAPDPFSVESLIAARNAFFKIFEIAATPTVLGEFRRRVSATDSDELQEMEDLARSRIRPDAAGASAARWFERMTTRLERLREVEDLQLEQMLRRATLTKPH